MANKPVPKQTKKEQEEAKKRRWMIIIFAVIMIGIMIIVPLATLFNPTSLHNIETSDNTQRTGTFNSIVDALMDLPSNAQYVRFVDLNASQAVTDWSMLNIGYNIPNESYFGRLPYKDAVASFPYPTMGLSIVENPQVIVLSDFGRGYDNASYTKTTTSTGTGARLVQGTFAFSTDSYPTIVGRKEYVGLIDNFMKTATLDKTAYATYAALIEQTNRTAANATFAVVGTSSSLGFGDMYYAGVTPFNGTLCDYKIVIHLNQTMNESKMVDISNRWQDGASLYGITANAPQFKGEYVIMSAKGDIDMCLNDMVTSWGFVLG